jgi:hypothetical protein
VIRLDLVHSPIAHPPDNLTYVLPVARLRIADIRFEIRDILYGLGYEDDCFDVVHIRDIGFGVSALVVTSTDARYAITQL